MPVDGHGHITIPKEYTHIKVDVGLSFNAPNSALWLDKYRLPGRFVIGIEPNAKSLRRIESGHNHLPYECDSSNLVYKLVREENRPHWRALNASHVGTDWYGLNAAVDEGQPRFQSFNVAELTGTDSLLDVTPHSGLKVVAKTYVPVIRLSDVFDRIDFDRFQVIEHLKVDAQGMDGRVLRSAKHYLKERVVYVTAESYTFQYVGGGQVSVDEYLLSQGFHKLHGETWINGRFKDDASMLASLDGNATET